MTPSYGTYLTSSTVLIENLHHYKFIIKSLLLDLQGPLIFQLYFYASSSDTLVGLKILVFFF